MYQGHMAGDWLSMALYMSFFWIVLILIVAAVVWAFLRSGAAQVSGDHGKALQILEERYARGEINKEEFLEKRQHLGH